MALRDAVTNPALSGADPGTSPARDQRGVRRPAPAGTDPDIGAFELPQRAISRAPSANNDVLGGRGGRDVVDAQAGNDLVRGRGGNDLLASGAGNDVLVGGSGHDIAVEAGRARDFKVIRQGSGWLVADRRKADGDAGRDWLTGIEQLSFDDRSLDLATGKADRSRDEIVARTGEHGDRMLAGG